eukprot:3714052-Lingulodinium_polyedra.AAC.1
MPRALEVADERGVCLSPIGGERGQRSACAVDDLPPVFRPQVPAANGEEALVAAPHTGVSLEAVLQEPGLRRELCDGLQHRAQGRRDGAPQVKRLERPRLLALADVARGEEHLPPPGHQLANLRGQERLHCDGPASADQLPLRMPKRELPRG